jgi:hypothetical protein
MKICVGSGRGYSGRAFGPEEPGAFYLGGRRLPVLAIVERWTDPQHAYYKVQVEDGRRFVLRCEASTRCWELVSVAKPATPAKATKPAPARPALQRW